MLGAQVRCEGAVWNQDNVEVAEPLLQLFAEQFGEVLDDYEFVNEWVLLIHDCVFFFADANRAKAFLFGAFENV